MTLSYTRMLDAVWLLLMALTIGSALLAESADPSLLVTLFVAISVAVKGGLVVERFMELRTAHPYIRFSMGLFFIVLPLLMMLVFLFPEQIADLTRI
ncbi:thiosulfate reductase [Motiliproteus coralliicola]|uniref:Thiosulfate reductase n=1 Tax=Motiliproteus coralliicola TaxID=2283196 RepID=A0A369WB34_9GAMM|nr:cytochrome C oxidase subunit IV family protein [Motiliproteus coralliicola]RDE19022.1 thiosulfate reductase [Motiliproteus coralliicola]